MRELLATEDAVAIPPGRLPYGAVLRAPAPLRPLLAWLLAWRIKRAAGGPVDVVVAYHAVQWPAVERLLATGTAKRAWYMRWDRYEAAHDAGEHATQLLTDWHARLAMASSLTFTVSDRLAELEHEAGRQAICVGQPADSFPSEPLQGRLPGTPLPEGSLVAVSLGHLGRRTNWSLLRQIVELAPELYLVLVGRAYPHEAAGDPDFAWLELTPRVRWLGPLDDCRAAEAIAAADVGIVPFRVEPFNDAGLPNRILKYARLGRRTVSPTLEGSRTWSNAVDFADTPAQFVAALRAQAGRRAEPDAELRAWALEQTAAKMNAPLHAALRD